MIARIGIVTHGGIPQVSAMRLRLVYPRRTAHVTATVPRQAVCTGGVPDQSRMQPPQPAWRQIVEIDGRNPHWGCLRTFSGQPEVAGPEDLSTFFRVKTKILPARTLCGRVEDMTAHNNRRPHADLWIINEVRGVGYEIVKEVRSGGGPL